MSKLTQPRPRDRGGTYSRLRSLMLTLFIQTKHTPIAVIRPTHSLRRAYGRSCLKGLLFFKTLIIIFHSRRSRDRGRTCSRLRSLMLTLFIQTKHTPIAVIRPTHSLRRDYGRDKFADSQMKGFKN